MVNCAWHIQRNLIKKLSHLSKADKALYNKVISLPFISRKSKFEDLVKEIKKSKLITSNEKEYLEGLLIRKEKWAKSVLKDSFGGGVNTTSRVEGLHGILRKYLTSKSSLQNVFYAFREIEDIQIDKFENEYISIKDRAKAQNIKFIQELKAKYPEYVVCKIIGKYFKALNYDQTLEIRKNNQW